MPDAKRAGVRSWRDCFVLVAALAASCVAPGPLAAQRYRVRDLTPSGFFEAYGWRICGCQQVGFGQRVSDSVRFGIIWTGTAESAVILTDDPPTAALGTNGTQQCGTATYADGGHPMLWSGTTGSGVDLKPASLNSAGVSGISGSQQVGSGSGALTGGSEPHALLWSGTADSVVDLHPPGYVRSVALATSGTKQVGYGVDSYGVQEALLWSGTPASAVCLQPDWPFWQSQAHGVSGTQQVGYGVTQDQVYRAVLWQGSAQSATVLHPWPYSGEYTFSEALATNGTQQVGHGIGPTTATNMHAFLWSGSAETAEDLHAYVPAQYVSSEARGIDANGTIIGWVNDSTRRNSRAVLWMPAAPADSDWDWRAAISEVTAYGAAWKKGQAWPVGPSPIPIAYVTRYGMLWKKGEMYDFDLSALQPVCWVPSGGRAARLPDAAVVQGRITATAIMRPARYVPGRPVTASVVVTCGRGVAAWCLEERVPAGWVVTRISDGGHWDRRAGTMRWGPFANSRSRTLTYTLVTSNRSRGTQVLSGVVSADGINTAVVGTRSLRAHF